MNYDCELWIFSDHSMPFHAGFHAGHSHCHSIALNQIWFGFERQDYTPKSRKLAVASWSYSCFSKGRGRPESNTEHSDFSTRTPPKHSGHFEAVLEADGHGLRSCQVSRQSAFSILESHQNPISFQAHINLSFRSPSPWASSNPPQI